MDQVKKLLFFGIPMSICNFRCGYCYLSQRETCYQGEQPPMRYTPEQVGYAMREERVGGKAFINLCANGETLLTKNIDLYVKALVEQGHYAEVVTNLTVTPMLERFLAWDRELLKRLEFKCSFHYLELKKKKLLEQFAQNVQKVWDAGASANIEMVSDDSFIPYLDEIKTFSMEHFGALPHVTVARDDRTKDIRRLTKLPLEEYNQTWGQFESGFFDYKTQIFGVKQKGFCYAGKYSLYIDLTTGAANRCYFGSVIGNAFENPEEPLPESPVGYCRLPHCYNGHSLLTLGLIPNLKSVGYGEIRDREKQTAHTGCTRKCVNFWIRSSGMPMSR